MSQSSPDNPSTGRSMTKDRRSMVQLPSSARLSRIARTLCDSQSQLSGPGRRQPNRKSIPTDRLLVFLHLQTLTSLCQSLEDCEEVNRLLSKLHGEVKAADVIREPSRSLILSIWRVLNRAFGGVNGSWKFVQADLLCILEKAAVGQCQQREIRYQAMEARV